LAPTCKSTVLSETRLTLRFSLRHFESLNWVSRKAKRALQISALSIKRGSQAKSGDARLWRWKSQCSIAKFPSPSIRASITNKEDTTRRGSTPENSNKRRIKDTGYQENYNRSEHEETSPCKELRITRLQVSHKTIAFIG